MKVESQFPLDGIIAAHVVDQNNEVPPVNMHPVDDKGLVWQLSLVNPNPNEDRIHVAASANRTLYYGDAALMFIEYGTSFNQDFRQ